jgi:hypothetical protein
MQLLKGFSRNNNTEAFWNYVESQQPKHVFVSGGFLNNTFDVLDGRIENWIGQGGSFEFVILDPKSPAARLFSDNIYGRDNFDDFCNDLQRTVRKLTTYKEKCDRNISISLNNHVPPFKIIAMYDEKPISRDGIIYDGVLPKIIKVINYSEHIPHNEWLCFTLDNENDIPYKYYCKQLKMIRRRLYPPLTMKMLKEMIDEWKVVSP